MSVSSWISERLKPRWVSVIIKTFTASRAELLLKPEFRERKKIQYDTKKAIKQGRFCWTDTQHWVFKANASCQSRFLKGSRGVKLYKENVNTPWVFQEFIWTHTDTSIRLMFSRRNASLSRTRFLSGLIQLSLIHMCSSAGQHLVAIFLQTVNFIQNVSNSHKNLGENKYETKPSCQIFHLWFVSHCIQ